MTAQAVVAGTAPVLPFLEDEDNETKQRSRSSSWSGSVSQRVRRMESRSSSRAGSQRDRKLSKHVDKQCDTPAAKRAARTPGTGSSWALPTPPMDRAKYFSLSTPVDCPRDRAADKATWGRITAQAVSDLSEGDAVASSTIRPRGQTRMDTALAILVLR